MRRLLLGFAIGLALYSLTLGQDVASTENSKEFAFFEGGFLRLQLASGDYTVRAGRSDHVLVRWRTDEPEHQRDMKKIKVQTSVSGNVASLRTDGPTKHARIIIEVPARSDLHLRMRAGDLRVVGIEGNKDIRLTAGDLKIDVLPASYSHVHASVTFGDLNARPLGISKDGIGNSFEWSGQGKYTLHASLFAGDLILERPRLQ
jgi:hypothetical protein